jgi:predicted phosphodiesterase
VLRDASLTAFDQLVAAAIAHDVQFVVIAGDVYDGVERGVRAQLRFRSGLERLGEAGIRTFVVHGNHDPIDDGWGVAGRFHPLVHVFGSQHVESVSFDACGEPVTVHGISYDRPHVTENLALRFGRPGGPGFHLGVLHANVGGNTGHGDYSPCSVPDLAAAGMHYWALGHVHARRTLARDPWVVYPGNLQARRASGTEEGPKGALVVEVDGTRVSEPVFVALDAVRFAAVEVAIDGLDLASLVDQLVDGASLAAQEAHGRDLLATAVVSGRGPLHHELAVPGAAEDLLAHLRDAGGPVLWWTDLRLRTRRELDGPEGDAGDFLADMRREAAALADAGADDPRWDWATDGLTADLLRIGAGRDELPELWDEALALATELFAGDLS